MPIRPSIVIGLGSTGKYVVANIEKYLYEVLNASTLDVFHFIVLETDPTTQQDPSLPSGSRTDPVSIKVDDIGGAIRGFKLGLGDRFNWSPDNLRIEGPGAGNKRAAGRLMLLAKMNEVQQVLQNAFHQVQTAAMGAQVRRKLNELLERRGVTPEPNPFANTTPVVYVVGTLAGGTCSGGCIDLAYLIRYIQPTAYREGIFFFPDDNAIDTYKANSWAALNDLVYFAENPSSYSVEWLNSARQEMSYATTDNPATPYHHVYLLSQRDQRGDLKMPYAFNPSSPLLMMAGMYLAADLLGMHSSRQARLVDLNQRVGDSPTYNMLLTSSLRGVSYPKYEITEAAACRMIAERICSLWLDSEKFGVREPRQLIEAETVAQRGRDRWNAISPGIWSGLRARVDLQDLVKQIIEGHVTEVDKHLKHLFSDDEENTIYRQVQQTVAGRIQQFQNALRTAFAEELQHGHSLAYAECFIGGVKSEIERTRKFGEKLGTPAGQGDQNAWADMTKRLVSRLTSRMHSTSVVLVGEKRQLLEDELSDILLRLEMFLMHKALTDLCEWIKSDLKKKATRVRRLLEDIRTLAGERAATILGDLGNNTGPLLKVSRSQQTRFEVEIAELTKCDPPIPPSEYVSYGDPGFAGLLPFGTPEVAGEKERLFHTLKSRIQPILLQKLQQDAPINIVHEIEAQGVAANALQRARDTQGLSITTTSPMMTGKDNVPSFVVAKSTESAQQLMTCLATVNKDVPALAAQALPIFDHIALFYQEGGKFLPDMLTYAASFRRAYEAALKQDEGTLEPLRFLKKPPQPAAKTKSIP